MLLWFLKLDFYFLQDAGITPNITVFGALIRRSHLNFYYKKVLLKEMEMEGLKPNTKILQTIEIQLKKARNKILEKVWLFILPEAEKW